MLNVKANAELLLKLIGQKKGYLELLAFRAGKGPIEATRFVDLSSDDTAEQVIEFWTTREDCDLYFGVHVRFRKPDLDPSGRSVRSKAEHICVVTCVYLDIDAKDHGGDMDVVLANLEKVPCRPHYKLLSGHGVQAIWLLDEPLDVSDEKDLARYRNILRRLQSLTGGDHVHNLDRPLRVPGSVNRKFPNEPVQTVAEWGFEHPRVSLNEWESVLPPVDPEATKRRYNIEFLSEIPDVPWDRLPKWFTARETKDNRSDQDFYACCTMLRLGMTIDEIYAVYQQDIPLTSRYQDEKKKGRADEYLKRTLNAALNELHGNVPALIVPELANIKDKSLEGASTATWIQTCLQCDWRQWGSLLWTLHERSSLDDKSFKELVENQLYELFNTTSVNNAAPELGLTYDANMPWGYVVHQGLIMKLNPTVHMTEGAVRIRLGNPVIGFAAAILNRQVDEDKKHYFEVVHCARGQRDTITVPSSTVLRATDISKLADDGLDISSNDAKNAVEYFAQYVQTNKTQIPVLNRITRCGWHGNGFVYGSNLIQVNHAVVPDSQGGEQLLVQALNSSKGSLGRQLKLVKRALEHPKVALGIYASFAAPLLNLWNEQGFLIDFAGTSSVGKSTTLQLIGSLWGQADKRGSAENVIHPWKGTYPSHERYLEFMQNLPCFLDETKTMIKDEKTREIVVDVAYSAANGIGKARAKIHGTQAPSTWRTALFSTGEQPLSTLSKDGGLAARVIQIWGTPFGGDVTKQLVDWFDRESYENCGWMGKKFIEYTVGNFAQIKDLQPKLSELKQQYFKTDDSIAARRSDYFAVIALAGMLVHQVFPELGQFDIQVLEELFQKTVGSDQAQTQGYIALELLESLVGSEPEAFSRASTAHVIKGRVQNLKNRDQMRYVALLPTVFEDLMRKYNLDPVGVLREWEEKGWLDVAQVGGRKITKFKCGDSKMYRLQMENLPAEFHDGFRDPKFWVVVGDSLDEAREVEQEIQQQKQHDDKVVQFPTSN